MNNNKLTALITRPEYEGRVLAEKLTTLGVNSFCQPLFDYHSNQCQKELSKILNVVHQPIIIFISVAAVRFANKALPLSQWPISKILAVGSATANAVNNLGLECTSPEVHQSEGLLSLPVLQAVKNQDIIIVRGDGGRELLAKTLKSRGAKTHYFEAYQRIWRQLTPNIAQHWRQNNVNCIVITSNALLKSVVQLTTSSDNYWQNICIWVVASERIAQQAREFGLINVINANGANDDAITKAIIKNGTRL